jgi:hypothetical protein
VSQLPPLQQTPRRFDAADLTPYVEQITARIARTLDGPFGAEVEAERARREEQRYAPLTPAEERAALAFNSPEEVAAYPYRSLRRAWKSLYFAAHYSGQPAPDFVEWRAALNVAEPR